MKLSSMVLNLPSSLLVETTSTIGDLLVGLGVEIVAGLLGDGIESLDITQLRVP